MGVLRSGFDPHLRSYQGATELFPGAAATQEELHPHGLFAGGVHPTATTWREGELSFFDLEAAVAYVSVALDVPDPDPSDRSRRTIQVSLFIVVLRLP